MMVNYPHYVLRAFLAIKNVLNTFYHPTFLFIYHSKFIFIPIKKNYEMFSNESLSLIILLIFGAMDRQKKTCSLTYLAKGTKSL